VGEKALETVMPPPDPEILALVGVPDWADDRHIRAAWALSMGFSAEEAGEFAGVTGRTVHYWLRERKYLAEFRQLRNKLAFHSGIATRGFQLLEVKRLARELAGEGVRVSLKKHDMLDLMRYARELSGDQVERPDHPVIQFINQLFQVNVAGAPPAVSDVVDGEVRELEEP